MITKDRLGYVIPGAYISNYPIYKTNIWNNWDDHALIKSLSRRPNEDNIIFRNRIINAKDYNSTRQGIINWLSDSFDLSKYNINDKKIFNSIHLPMSYMQYNKLVNKTDDYFPPEVIADGITFKFPLDDLNLSSDVVGFEGIDDDNNPYKYYYSYEKTVIYDITFTKKWTLWKNIDQSYFTIFEGNYAPVEIKLRYQTLIDDELFTIEESALKLTRNENGEIVEE